MKKRTWYYAQHPKEYGMSPCSCGNDEIQWSEYEKHLWCDRCKKDFEPEQAGVFDGPILPEVCGMIGIFFDRINLETNMFERFDIETLEYVPTKNI
jgi:hypothetical protein